jgi:hypothetical protein
MFSRLFTPYTGYGAYMMEVALAPTCQEEAPHATRLFNPEYLIAQQV